jgi:uncharacterized protein YjbI with pentapeptide repeats
VRLEGADLTEALLDGARLRQVSLREADLRFAPFIYADLEGASLRHAKTMSATMVNTSLERADLRDAFLEDSDLRGAKLDHALLDRAYAGHVCLTDARLREASLVGAHLITSRGINVDLRGADLRRAQLYDSSNPYNMADLHRVKLEGANLTGVRLPKLWGEHGLPGTGDFGGAKC